jgi:hypothetical protein
MKRSSGAERRVAGMRMNLLQRVRDEVGTGKKRITNSISRTAC